MPVRKDLLPFYQTPEYKEARARVVERAGNKCEECRKPNGEKVETFTDHMAGLRGARCPVMFWRTAGSGWVSRFGLPAVPAFIKRVRTIRVVCICAHLNHAPGDDRDENLRFLCQWCHLHHDASFHKQTTRPGSPQVG